MSDCKDILADVLVIDDDPILRAIVEAHCLKQGSRRVQMAEDGQEALRILDRSQASPSLLLVDLGMPRMDGVQFLRHLEERQFCGAVAIVSGQSLSVITLATALAEKHQLNVIGALQKPLKTDELDSLIAAIKPSSPGVEARAPSIIDVDDLRFAIANGDITAHYQPKIDLTTGRTVGVEALARWEHKEWGLIPPSNFIPMAERYNLVGSLTGVVLRAAILDLRQWFKHGFSVKCAINLSVHSLEILELPDQIAACVDAAGLDRSRFIFEVTESSLLRKEASPMEVLARLRLMGFDLSIDDFGTGSSNFEHLRDFPFSELKIDQSFVRDMEQHAFAQQCVHTSVELGKKLNLRLVAEGVETQNVNDAVKALGVHHVQGYLYSAPMPSARLLEWLKRDRAAAQAAFQGIGTSAHRADFSAAPRTPACKAVPVI